MKNTASKALGISFGFHLLMALLAVWALGLTRPPMAEIRIPLKSMSLVSLSEPSPTPISTPASTVPSPLKPIPAKAITPPPVTPKPAISTPLAPVPASPIAATIPVPQIAAAAEAPSAVRVAPAETKAPAPSLPVKERPKTDLSAELQAFKTALRAKIQQNLRYPSAARRRGMEGEVDVRFVLENSGAVRDINIRRGEGIFHDAARLAVASASGMKIPESLSASFPEEMAITLEFRLN